VCRPRDPLPAYRSRRRATGHRVRGSVDHTAHQFGIARSAEFVPAFLHRRGRKQLGCTAGHITRPATKKTLTVMMRRIVATRYSTTGTVVQLDTAQPGRLCNNTAQRGRVRNSGDGRLLGRCGDIGLQHDRQPGIRGYQEIGGRVTQVQWRIVGSCGHLHQGGHPGGKRERSRAVAG
jgi:hypothetical protein